MDRQHQLTARYYSTLYGDLSTVRVHINREFCTRYTDADIDKMVNTGRLEPKRRPPSNLSSEPVSYTPPISTTKGGIDPLAVATNAYIERNADKIRRLAR